LAGAPGPHRRGRSADHGGTRINSFIRTIFFDLDGTLVFHEPDSYEVVVAFCAEIGQPLSQEAWRRGRRVRHEYFVDPVVREQLATMSRDEFWRHYNRHILAAVGIQGDLDPLVEEIGRRFADIDLVYRCPDATCRTLAELRMKGYRLGLITNREDLERLNTQLDEIGLRLYFDWLVAAGEAGVSKPDPAIFHLALERAGVPAGQALYVGDNYWADVVGAERAGLRAVLLDPHHLFPEAGCPVLDRIEDLPGLIDRDLLTWLA
jgi:putative hydrolase of the HAD superfamily